MNCKCLKKQGDVKTCELHGSLFKARREQTAHYAEMSVIKDKLRRQAALTLREKILLLDWNYANWESFPDYELKTLDA
jgi:hypothetical protein